MAKSKPKDSKKYQTTRQQRILQIVVIIISTMLILSMALSAINF